MGTDQERIAVLESTQGATRVLTLNRPEKMNAFSTAMFVGLAERLRAAEADPSVRAVVLTGAGDAFSAGGDRSLLAGWLAGAMADSGAVTGAHAEIASCLTRLEVPVIAAVNGPALGIAVEFVALCDLVVMAENAYLCENHVQFGMAPATGVAQRWPQLTSPIIAKELLMTARRVGAHDAVRLGLANRVVPPGEALTVALALAEEIVAMPRSGPAAVKAALDGRPVPGTP